MSTAISRARAIAGMDVVQSVSGDLGTGLDTILISGGATYTDGSSTGNINAAWSDAARALADGADETLNLTNASLTDKIGRTVDFSAIKALYIKNNFVAGNLVIGAAAATPVAMFGTPATETLLLGPGADMLITWAGAGLAVSTNCNLKIAHDGSGSAAGTYDIAILGVGAYA
jgi:hypothetical protein